MLVCTCSAASAPRMKFASVQAKLDVPRGEERGGRHVSARVTLTEHQTLAMGRPLTALTAGRRRGDQGGDKMG